MDSEGNEVTLTKQEESECLKHAIQKKYFETGETKLTEEEKSEVIARALDHKIGARNADIYWKDVYNPKPVSIPTAEILYKTAIKTARETIEDFEIDHNDKNIYGLLSLYFAKDERFLKSGGSLKKGLSIYGNVGCGKTSMIRIFRLLGSIPFPVVSCDAIVREYKEKDGGSKVIDKYINYNAICLDDLGTESTAKHMGNESNVISEIIIARYNKELASKQFKTHITTNLTGEDIESYYGTRFADRCVEMFNIIQFSQDSKSKRK